MLVLSHNRVKKLARQMTMLSAPLRARHLGALWRGFGNLFTRLNYLHFSWLQDAHEYQCTCLMHKTITLNVLLKSIITLRHDAAT